MKINDIFAQRGFVAVKLKNCIRERGFTKVSFARKAGISRPMLDELLEGSVDNERVFDDCISRALDALNISEDDWACFVPKHKSTDTVCRESVPKEAALKSAIENDPFLSYIVNAIKYAAGETV